MSRFTPIYTLINADSCYFVIKEIINQSSLNDFIPHLLGDWMIDYLIINRVKFETAKIFTNTYMV